MNTVYDQTHRFRIQGYCRENTERKTNFFVLIIWFPKFRFEQAPRSGFHPCDESDKLNFGFLGPFWCIKKVYPDRKVSCVS